MSFYLGGTKDEIDGEEVVCIGAPCVDPQVVDNGAQSSSRQQHAGHDEQLLCVRDQVPKVK